ncbi:MAG TPA: hypothetical protein VJX68_12250 [Candidatus Binatus sp.]|uniref:hypothetical protein n=1 Tax=Candidatus Binatus sp. TaxID=2811406 RepID=UPI002B4A11A3|nr:hypothetical protein [Candidatus Binatus sp.]HKN13955.1 hypothetical protein [Candidatus Binatus sp.]
MKGELQDQLILAPRTERAILDEIRNDRELIARLRVTPQELEALSKCALLGTLTCKQDMLFILRQIREATSPDIDHATIFPQPAVPEEQDEEDPIPDFRRMPSRAASAVIPEPGSLDGIVRTRRSEQFGILFWVVVLVVGLIWNGVIVISRWRENFVTSIGSPVNQPTTSAAWYSSLDRFNVLLTWETLFIVGVAVIVYLRNRDSRRIRIRSSRRYN